MDISASEFRENFFRILRQAEQTHEDGVITQRGKPIARMVFIKEEKKRDPLLGALAGLGHTRGDLTEPVVEPNASGLDRCS